MSLEATNSRYMTASLLHVAIFDRGMPLMNSTPPTSVLLRFHMRQLSRLFPQLKLEFNCSDKIVSNADGSSQGNMKEPKDGAQRPVLELEEAPAHVATEEGQIKYKSD
jgi:hypothetical protein